MQVKTLGIAIHGAEGGMLCFLTACQEGAVHLGPRMHPTIVVSAVPMGLRNHLETKSDNNILLLRKSRRRIGQAAVPEQSARELKLCQIVFALSFVARQQAPAFG